MIKPRKAIEQIVPYETDVYRQDWRLKLDANENIYGCSSVLMSAIKSFSVQDVSLYPVYGALVDRISEKYQLKKDEILFSNGCDEALNILINTYLECEDEILSFSPTFSMPSLYARVAGASARSIEYEQKYIFSKDRLKQEIKPETKIVYLATPNNPTGEIVKASVVELFLQDFPDTLFIIDCTYVNFSYKVAFEDYIDLTRKYSNVAVVKSYSKDFGLAGLRFGLTIADSSIIDNLKKVISPYSVNAFAINCMQMVLNEEARLEEVKELNKEARDYLFDELIKHNFVPYKSEANFILCDFGAYCDFYYEKFRKNGVIVRKYSKNSSLGTCLRITVPKMGGVKFITELLNKKDLLILDVDGVIFDVRHSYMEAIARTYEHFAGHPILREKIYEVKSQSGMNCDWDAAKYLLDESNINVAMSDIITVFQNLFYNSKEKRKNYLIDEEELLISKEIFERLSQKYDLVVFTGRFKEEVKYSFEKFDIDKYFYYYVTSDDLPKNMLKPHPKGVFKILEHCPHKSVKYFGDAVDDVIAGNSANVTMIGVVSPGVDYNLMINNFTHLGVRHILGDVKNIENYLEEFEKEHV